MALPSGASRTPLHELHVVTCVQHVGIWRVCVGHFCVCTFVFGCLVVLSHTTQAGGAGGGRGWCLIWHILSPEHFPVSLLTIIVYVCGN